MVKLGPYLGNISAEGFKNLFISLVMPLFDAVFMLLEFESSKTHRYTIKTTKAGLFKQFMRLICYGRTYMKLQAGKLSLTDTNGTKEQVAIH